MLTYISDSAEIALPFDDYSITHKWSGVDSIEFSIPTDSEFYAYISEEKAVIETTEKQKYITKMIDRGKDYTTIMCELDIDEFKRDMFIGFNNKSNTCYGTVNQVCPGGWTIVDKSAISIRRTIDLEGPTALDVINRCAVVYSVCFRFDTNAKILTIINPDSFTPVGAFVTADLNLKDLNYMGKSLNLITRIYAVGKDGLTFSSINGGKSYVDDNSYTNKIISYYWKDERYTDKESLLADAKKKLKISAIPLQSYDCIIDDLRNTNPDKYGFLDFSLFNVATLIDKAQKTRLDHQVVETTTYPYYSELNSIKLSTVAPSIQSTVKNIQDSLSTPNSGFQQRMQALLSTLGESISGELGGNMIITQNANGKPNGIKIMDTDNETTAQKILWLNLAGITYSANGGNTYSNVWSFERGGFIADWIVAGTLNADLIKAGTIDANLVKIRNLITDHVQSESDRYKMTLWAATLKLMDRNDLRASIYVTAPNNGDTFGMVRVTRGKETETGESDINTRVSALTPNLLAVGEKKGINGDVEHDGEIKCGAVNCGDVYCEGIMYATKEVRCETFVCRGTPYFYNERYQARNVTINGISYRILCAG